MANQPTDPAWPPGDSIQFDDMFDKLLLLKRDHFPQHTATDDADPFIQLLRFVAALGDHSVGRLNRVLKQLDPKTATNRRALIALMEVVNRPLLEAQPARGYIYARVTTPLAADTTVFPVGTRIAQVGSTDPNFTIDEAVTTNVDIDFDLWYDNGVPTQISPLTASFTLAAVGSSIIIGFDPLAFDGLTVALATPAAGAVTFSAEYSNNEWARPQAVIVSGANLKFRLDDYLHDAEVGAVTDGLELVVRHTPTGVEEVISTASFLGKSAATTSYLGQAVPSTSPSDYLVYAAWRPIPMARASADPTGQMLAGCEIEYDISALFSDTDWWHKHETYSYAFRFRAIAGATLPDIVKFSAIANDGDHYAVTRMTQGYRPDQSIGTTTGEAFDFVPVPSEPLSEPVHDPEITLDVGGETYFVVDDFSNSGSTSKHAIFREDVDDGYGIMFGDGAIGKLPSPGSTIKITYRTGSLEPGDLDAGAELRFIGGPGTVANPTLPRGTFGYEAKEANDASSAKRFRQEVIPQLALRAESVITADEIVTAMSGGAPNRATFETEDGRLPFSRAAYSVTAVGDRQYRIVVVGPESDASGDILPDDLVEAAEWLNGKEVGVEIIGGHGPNNTQALLTAFTQRRLLPTVTITSARHEGKRGIADQIIRGFFKPHSRDEDEAFRWSFGGQVPIAVLFGLLWDGIPRDPADTISISVIDGSTALGIGDSIDLTEFELPVLDSSYIDTVNIVLVTP